MRCGTFPWLPAERADTGINTPDGHGMACRPVAIQLSQDGALHRIIPTPSHDRFFDESMHLFPSASSARPAFSQALIAAL